MENLRCYAEISIENLLYNFECIKSLIPDGCEIIPIIKANAYSHGALECAKALSDKTKMFAVAELDEALELRRNGIKNGILVLGYTDAAFVDILSDNAITQSVATLEYGEKLSECLGDKTLDIHIKLDTGMHRFGFDADAESTVSEIVRISKMKGLNINGIFSHFTESDSLNSDFTDCQLCRFKNVIFELKKHGVDIETVHIANSAAALTRYDAAFSAVRTGIILYGAYPSIEIKEKYLKDHPDKPLREVMTLCAKVGQVLRVKKGEGIGYSRTYTASRDSVIATVTAGYADGIPRQISNKGRVKINGEAFNIVGNVCMDLLMVDITDAKKEIVQGDTVTFWGSDGIDIDEYAGIAGTISYALYTEVSRRVKRIYK